MEKTVDVSLQDPTRYDCKICNIENIHKNDYEKHVKGKLHKRHLRDNEKNNEVVDNAKYTCKYCNVDLTDHHFYKIHIGSKAHKRNLRKLGITEKPKVPDEVEEDTSKKPVQKRGRSLLVPRHLGFRKSDLFREKYKTRNIAIEEDYFKSYITEVTAYLTIKFALDPATEDFFISVNDKEWNSFGDIVIKLVQKDKSSLYAIKCKQVSNSYKQIESLNQAKVILEKEFAILDRIRRNADFGIATFGIFTSLNTTSNFFKTYSKSLDLSARTLNKWKSSDKTYDKGATVVIQSLKRKSVPINVTTDRENVFSFAVPSEFQVSLPNLLFLTNQFLFGSKSLNDLLKKKFENYPDISKDFTKYIENWIDGKLGGSYKLRKKDIILKLGQILLRPYTISPKIISLKQDNFEAWNKILDQVDLTIIKNEPFIMSKVSQPINQTIENIFGIKIDTISKTVTIKGKIDDNTDPALKAYLFEEINDLSDDIQLVQMYTVLWKYGKIPLLLSSEQNEGSKGFIQDVIGFMKLTGVSRKFLLKTSDPQKRPKDKIKVFSCLEDVRHLVDLNNIFINIPGSFKLPLETISNTDPFFLKWITPAIFFDMALDKYSFRPNLMKSDSKQQPQDLKIILSDELRELLFFHLYGNFTGSGNNLSSVPDESDSIRKTTIIQNMNVGRLRGIDHRLFRS